MTDKQIIRDIQKAVVSAEKSAKSIQGVMPMLRTLVTRITALERRMAKLEKSKK